jgi:hypothetical protein
VLVLTLLLALALILTLILALALILTLILCLQFSLKLCLKLGLRLTLVLALMLVLVTQRPEEIVIFTGHDMSSLLSEELRHTIILQVALGSSLQNH